jgi:hypothetical protein
MFRPRKPSSFDVDSMSAAAINKRLDAIDKHDSELTSRMIAAGRGYETSSETMAKAQSDSNDKLAGEIFDTWAERMVLIGEIRRRAGPGMSRLPRGFGPMKKNPGPRVMSGRNKKLEYRGKYPERINQVYGHGAGVVVRTNNGKRYFISAKNTGGYMPKPGDDIFNFSGVEPYEPPKQNPRKRKRKSNPTGSGKNTILPENVSHPKYSSVAVDKAIASSIRAGRKISKRQATSIHRLLKGRHENPSAFILYARRPPGPVMYFDGKKFTNNGTPYHFGTLERARAKGLEIHAKHSRILTGYKIWVDSVPKR